MQGRQLRIRLSSLPSCRYALIGLVAAAGCVLAPMAAAPASAAGAPGFKVIATVNVKVNPFGLTLAPDGKTIWIANAGPITGHIGQVGHVVTVLDERRLTVESVIKVGKFPEEITFSQGGRQALVTNSTSGTVSVIDAATRRVTQTVNLAGIPMTFPFGIAAAPAQAKVFVTSLGGASKKTVAVLCDRIHAPVRICGTVKAPAFTGGGVLTPGGKTVVITRGRAYNGPPEITVISTRTNKIVADVKIPGKAAAQTVAVTPDGRFAYAALFGYGGAHSGAVWVVNLVTHKSVKIIRTPDSSMIGTAVSPDGRFVVATDFKLGKVSVISTATNSIIANIKVGKEPNGLAFSANGRRLFVANQDATTVSVIAVPAGHPK